MLRLQTIRDGGLRGFAAFLLVVVPPVVFEKYTYYLYTISSPTFFTFSGDRLWFDIGWFIGSGAFSALILGRKNALAILPPLAGAWAFIVAVYDVPFCQAAECYINSTDGFAWLRDFLLFASLGILACSAVLSREAPILGRSERQKLLFKVAYSFAVSVFVVYALGFFQFPTFSLE